MVLMKEMQNRLQLKEYFLEWNDIIRDLDNLEEVMLEQRGKHFTIRVGYAGCCGKVFQAAGVAIPPMIRESNMNEPEK
jgi:hypothetical protein